MIRRVKRWWCGVMHSSPSNLMYAGGGEWECRRCGLRGEVPARHSAILWVPRSTVRRVDAPKKAAKVRKIG